MSNKKFMIFVVLVILSIPVMMLTSGFFAPKDQPDLLFEKATVLDIVEENLSQDAVIPDLRVGVQQLQLKLESGPFKGQTFFVKNALSRLYNVEAEEGSKLIVRVILKEGQIQGINVFNYNREALLYTLLALFLAVLVIFGRKHGLRSILSLTFTGSMIVFFMMPMLFKGYNAILLSLFSVSVITVVTLLLVSQWNQKTLAAMIGTVLGVLIAGLISYIAGELGHLSGITMNEAEELIYLAGDRGIQVKGLMFSAILIASLGAVMDVAMSIASAVFEFKTIDKKLGMKALWQSGMNVGRDVMGTMSDTLILAFVGGSLNVMVLIVAYQMPLRQIMNLDIIGTEIILSLAGSIGIVLTVPLTAMVSAVIASNRFNLKLPLK